MRVRRARAAELTAQLWAVSPEVAPPLRPPRQWRPHDCAHQRIIASRDISADTPPARGRGGGSARLTPQWVTRTSLPWCCASSPSHQHGTPLLSWVSRSPGAAVTSPSRSFLA